MLPIVFFGLAVRLWGIRFGLPYLYHPDEQKIVSTALGFGTGDLNPHFFRYPTLYMYIQFFFYALWFGVGKIFGMFGSAYEFAFAFAKDPTAIYTIGRMVTALFGTGIILATFALARELTGRRAALIAAAFVAGSFLLVQDSHFVTTDIPMAFFVILSLACAVRHNKSGQLKPLLWAALFCGLAASTKYNGGVVALGVFLAAINSPALRGRKISSRLISRPMLLAGLVMILGFLAGTPFALFDFAAFAKGVAFEVAHSQRGHLGFSVSQWAGWVHIKTSLAHGVGWPIAIAGMFGTVAALLFGAWEKRIVAMFGVFYFVLISLSQTVFQRYAIVLVPILAIFAAMVLVQAIESLMPHVRWKKGVLVAAAMLFVLPNIPRIVYHDLLLTRTDTRTEAMHWIEKNVSAQSVLVVDAYGPMEPNRNPVSMGADDLKKIKDDIKDDLKNVGPTHRVINISNDGRYDPDWIRDQNPEYLFVSSYVLDRLRLKIKDGEPAPFVDWLDTSNELELIETFWPYKIPSRAFVLPAFSMKCLYSPCLPALFDRSKPGPVIYLYRITRL